jgi:hypothetical protein
MSLRQKSGVSIKGVELVALVKLVLLVEEEKAGGKKIRRKCLK